MNDDILIIWKIIPGKLWNLSFFSRDSLEWIRVHFNLRFITLNLGMGAVSILYVPCLIMLRGVYDGKVSNLLLVVLHLLYKWRQTLVVQDIENDLSRKKALIRKKLSRWQWSWWHRDVDYSKLVTDFGMLVTEFRCWWHLLNVGEIPTLMRKRRRYWWPR